MYSTSEYRAPVWCRSAHPRLIDNVLNDAMRIVTRCLRLTTTNYWPIIAGIQPTQLRQPGATLSLAYRSLKDPKHLLHQLMVGSITAHEERLRSRHPLAPMERKLLNKSSKLSIQLHNRLTINWTKDKSNLRLCFSRPSARPFGMGLPRSARVRLNCLRTRVGRFQSSMHIWGFILTSICK